MLLSLGLIFGCGIISASICERIHLPRLLGMLISGMLLGPYALNFLDPHILMISGDLRQIALIIILSRAGLNLKLNTLYKCGRPAILMCFVPALIEITGMIILAPFFFKVSLLDAAIMGCVVAAVSPAIVVPKMLKIEEEGWGSNKNIPQMIMAGASVDDVLVIILFTSLLSLEGGNSLNIFDVIRLPLAILLGIVGGYVCGLTLVALFKKTRLSLTYKVLLLLSLSFIMMRVEAILNPLIGFSGLLAIMSLNIALIKSDDALALSNSFSKLWSGAEIILFVLVGACVNIYSIKSFGFNALLLILGVLGLRLVGVALCFIKTNLTLKERLFSMIAYLPKATVQAAICSIPLSNGLECGQLVITLGVLSIIICAPLGALLIDISYKHLLKEG